MEPLASYILVALTTWAPIKAERLGGENVYDATVRYDSIATDISEVVMDPDETMPMGMSRAEAGILLASLAFWESGLIERIDHGRCLPDECDFRHSWGIWQLKPEQGGFVLTTDGGWGYANWQDGNPILGPQLARNRRLAARLSLRISTNHIGAWSTWRKALPHARWWSASHPYTGKE